MNIDQVILLPFTDEYSEELLTWLENDDDMDCVKDYMSQLNATKDSTKRVQSFNKPGSQFRICIKTSYKALIPIGHCDLISSKDGNKCKLK